MLGVCHSSNGKRKPCKLYIFVYGSDPAGFLLTHAVSSMFSMSYYLSQRSDDHNPELWWLKAVSLLGSQGGLEEKICLNHSPITMLLQLINGGGRSENNRTNRYVGQKLGSGTPGWQTYLYPLDAS